MAQERVQDQRDPEHLEHLLDQEDVEQDRAGRPTPPRLEPARCRARAASVNAGSIHWAAANHVGRFISWSRSNKLPIAAGGTQNRLTFDAGDDNCVAWTADGDGASRRLHQEQASG